MQLVRLAMLIYTVLLMATIVTVFLVNRRCNRLNCGIPMEKVAEAIGPLKLALAMLLMLTVLCPMTLAGNLYSLFLDDGKFIDMANTMVMRF